MPLVRRNGFEVEMTVEEMARLFREMESPPTVSMPTAELTTTPQSPRKPKTVGLMPKLAKAAANGPVRMINPSDLERAKQVLQGLSRGQRAIVQFLVKAASAGLTTQDLIDQAHCDRSEASRRLSAIREASVKGGLRDASLIRFKKSGRGKLWFATTLLVSADSQSAHSPTLFGAENVDA
jgi:hypothetical protein